MKSHPARLAFSLVLVLLALPAVAQSQTDPIATVRAVYAADDINDLRFLARPLRRLFEKDAEEAKGEVGRLGFAYHVNGQDRDDDLAKTLRFTLIAADEQRAEVQARFKNGTPQDLRYDLVRENGRWMVANVRSLNDERWNLVEIMSTP